MFSVNKKLFTGLVFFGIVAGIINFFDPKLLAGIIFSAFLSGLGVLAINFFLKADSKTVALIFLLIFALHIVFVLFFYYTGFQPFSGGNGDYQKYDYNARVISSSFRSGDFSLKDKISYTGRPILEWDNYYPLLIALIYIFIMPSMLLGQLLNAWLVALSAVAVYLLVLEIGGAKKGAIITSLVVALYPSLAFYGSLLLKDALAIFFAMFGLLFAIKTINNFKLRPFLILYALLACLVHFRFYVGYALAISFALSWFLFCRLKIPEKIAYSVIIFLFFGFLPLFAGQDIFAYKTVSSFLNRQTITMYRETAYFPNGSKQTGNIKINPDDSGNIKINPDDIEIQQEEQYFQEDINPSASFLVKIDFTSPFLFVYGFVKSFIFTFLGPFFWQLKNLRQYLTLIETIPWYFFVFFIGRGLFLNIKKKYKDFFPLLIFAFILTGISSLYISNFGAITRIRIPAFMALLCIGPFGFTLNEKIQRFFKKLFSFLKSKIKLSLQIINNLKLSYKIYLSAYFLILLMALFFDKLLALSVIIITLLSFFSFLIARKLGIKDRKIYLIYLIAILIHLSAAVFIYYANFYPFGGGAGDQSKYHQMALELSQKFRHGDFSIKGFDKIFPSLYVPHFYPIFLAIIYALTVPSIIIGICLNVWFAALSIVFLYLLVKEISGSDKSAFLAGLIASIYPSYLYFGSLLIRDAILVCFVLFALLFLVKLVKNFSWKNFLILSLAIGIVLHFRFYIGVVMLLALSASWFLINLSKREKIKYGLCILLILGIFPQFFSGQGYFGLHFFQTFSNNENMLNIGRQGLLEAESVVVEKVGFENPVKFAGNIASVFVFISAGPFPWQINQPRQMCALLETIPWYFLIILILAGATSYLKAKNYKLIMPLLIFALTALLVLAVFIDNYGTYMRIRIPIFLALLAIADFSWIKLNLNSDVFSFFKSK